jgi:hypothetical protein
LSVNKFIIYCITETWLNNPVGPYVIIYLQINIVFRAERDYITSNKKREGGVLIEVSKSLYGVKRKYDLEMIKECVWVEILVRDNYNLLRGE